ncbi:MAG: hypothetical protein JSS29_12490 [Proteobacteria bacterium]|nr:hypothetical protein [Pseudomonadota bacterium]
MKRRRVRAVLAALAAAWIGVALWQTHKLLPAGMHVASPMCTVPGADVALLTDLTAADAYGHPVIRQSLRDAELRLISGAAHFVVLDVERFTQATGASGRSVAAELTEALLTLRRTRPEVRVLLILDPANEDYGATHLPQLALLSAAGVEVVSANLAVLRDPNFLYSALARLSLRWWGGPPGQLGAWLTELDFKAAHRKVLIVDDAQGRLSALVSSANPDDRESTWSNAGVRVSGGPADVLLRSELALAREFGWHGSAAGFSAPAAACRAAGDTLQADEARVQVLTEGATRQALVEQIGAASRGDDIELALFRLADRGVIEALLEAGRRGVRVRLILDPSEDATVHTPLKFPNQPLASELVARSGGSVQVRWYRTHGERFHVALARIAGPGRVWLLAGSANFTRRSLMDYNTEADVSLELTREAPLAEASRDYFDMLWTNQGAPGTEYTADFAVFSDPSQADYWLCRLLEGGGLAPF